MTQMDKWDELFNEASRTILGFMRRPEPEGMPNVKIATSVLSSYTRHEATESARQQTAVIVARSLAEDKQQFAEYLRLSVPQLSLPSGVGVEVIVPVPVSETSKDTKRKQKA